MSYFRVLIRCFTIAANLLFTFLSSRSFIKLFIRTISISSCANVHHKETREAACRRRDRALAKSREELHEEHDLASEAELHIEQDKVIRADA